MTDDGRVEQLRALLPATGAGIYLATHVLGPLPAEAAAAMREADDWELRVGRVAAGREEDVAQREVEARSVLAALVGADPDELVLTAGLRAARALAGEAALDLTLRAGAEPVTMESAGAIYFACDRWLLGPEGSAAVRLPSAARAAAARQKLDPLPRTTLVGLARAVGWLEMYVGLEWIFERTTSLAARLRDGLAALEGLSVEDRPDAAHVVTFAIGNWTAVEAADELSRRVFAQLSVADDEQALRASVAWFNTADELDRFLGAVAELARHTPTTLPRKPRLEVL